MARERWRESVSERHRRRHGRGKALLIRQINRINPQWPIAGWAGFMAAALAMFLFVAFAFYLPWYAPATYVALVAASVFALRASWPRWARHGLVALALVLVALALVRITPLYPAFLLALVVGGVLSMWVSYAREKDSRDRDAFKRERAFASSDSGGEHGAAAQLADGDDAEHD